MPARRATGGSGALDARANDGHSGAETDRATLGADGRSARRTLPRTQGAPKRAARNNTGHGIDSAAAARDAGGPGAGGRAAPRRRATSGEPPTPPGRADAGTEPWSTMQPADAGARQGPPPTMQPPASGVGSVEEVARSVGLPADPPEDALANVDGPVDVASVATRVRRARRDGRRLPAQARWSAVSAGRRAARAGELPLRSAPWRGRSAGAGCDPIGGAGWRCWRSGCCACMRGSRSPRRCCSRSLPRSCSARWQGLPLLVWLVLRAGYGLAGPRRWEVDPELVGMSQPIVPDPGRRARKRPMAGSTAEPVATRRFPSRRAARHLPRELRGVRLHEVPAAGPDRAGGRCRGGPAARASGRRREGRGRVLRAGARARAGVPDRSLGPPGRRAGRLGRGGPSGRVGEPVDPLGGQPAARLLPGGVGPAAPARICATATWSCWSATRRRPTSARCWCGSPRRGPSARLLDERLEQLAGELLRLRGLLAGARIRVDRGA